MQLLIQMMHQIPAGWPRWTILIATAVVYFLFPGLVKKITRNRLENQLVTEITQYLQMKKLFFEVEALKKEKDPGFSFPG